MLHLFFEGHSGHFKPFKPLLLQDPPHFIFIQHTPTFGVSTGDIDAQIAALEAEIRNPPPGADQQFVDSTIARINELKAQREQVAARIRPSLNVPPDVDPRTIQTAQSLTGITQAPGGITLTQEEIDALPPALDQDVNGLEAQKRARGEPYRQPNQVTYVPTKSPPPIPAQRFDAGQTTQRFNTTVDAPSTDRFGIESLRNLRRPNKRVFSTRTIERRPV